MRSKAGSYLTYQSEEDQVYILLNNREARLRVPKNRNVPESFLHSRTKLLTPAFRLLLAATLGLAPAGLGTLILAPLAALWVILIYLRYPLDRADRIRAAIILGAAIGLLGLAVPLSLLFLDRLV